MVTPIATFALLDRPLDAELAAGEELTGGALLVLDELVKVEAVECEVAVKAAKSLLSHQTGIPSPHSAYAVSLIILVAGLPSTTALFDKLVATYNSCAPDAGTVPHWWPASPR